MGWTTGPNDLTLGDPLGAHIRLLGDEAKIVLVNEFGTPIMEFDGSTTFGGDTFSRFLIRNKEGQDKLQLDQFQAALRGNTDTRIRMVPGDLPGQFPRLEIEPAPITEGRLTVGEVRGEADDANNGASLVVQSPTYGTNRAAKLTLAAQDSANPVRATLDADLAVNGSLKVGGKTVGGGRASRYFDVGTGQTTAATVYEDMTGLTLECPKVSASTLTNLAVRLSIAVKASVPTVVRFAANVGTVVNGVPTPGSDFSLGKLDISQPNVTVPFTIDRDLTGLGLGQRFIQIRWRVMGATGATLTYGADHSASVTATEVPA